MELDLIDKKILDLLQKDAKQTTKEIALKTNLSPTAVYERIKKLERNQYILKHTVLINKSKIDKEFTVFCHVKLKQHTIETIQEFEKEIKKLPEISECYHVSGDYDYILKVHTKDTQSFREFIVNKLTTIKSIGSTHSSITIAEVKNTTEHFLL